MAATFITRCSRHMPQCFIAASHPCKSLTAARPCHLSSRTLVPSRWKSNEHLPCPFPLSATNQATLAWKNNFVASVHFQDLFTYKKICRINSSRIMCTGSPDGHPFLHGAPDCNSFVDGKSQKQNTAGTVQNAMKLTADFLKRFSKLLLALFLLIFLGISGAPFLLSSQGGLHSALFLANKAIPGHATVQSMSLGWSKPVVVEGISLKGIDEKDVLIIPKLETKASLWSIVRGKAGFGDCTITAATIDLQKEKNTGLSNLALAIVPPRKLLRSQQQAKVFALHAKKKKIESAVDVALSATIKAPGGGLELKNGKLILPADVAAVLGQKVLLDMLIGPWATERNEELKGFHESKMADIPITVDMWADYAQAEVVGFLNLKKKEMNLVRPLKLEMDLSPAVAQLYLARVNPLLGEIVGPAVQDDDMPDIVLYVSPANLVLPADQYQIRFEPMKAILARGPLAGGILNLLSRGKKDVAEKRKEVVVQTSAIEADIGMDGSLKCSRIDFLIAGKVHVVTWGFIDWIDETLKMNLGIPGTTLSEVLGLSKLSKDYHLKIPIGGTLDQPQVDWKAAAYGIAQLALQQRTGKFMNNILAIFGTGEKSMPEPIAAVPWVSINI